MGIRKLVDKEHEALKSNAREVKKVTPPILKLMNDMVDTMKHHKGVGLAAPQIGISKQIIVVSEKEDEIIKLINPSIVESSGNSVDVEGCLSIPGVYGEVDRAAKTVVTAVNENNEKVCIEAEGYLARILQHEIDHLKGTLFVEKAKRFIDPRELKDPEENQGETE